jgi:D-alanine-D-alanine ligase
MKDIFCWRLQVPLRRAMEARRKVRTRPAVVGRESVALRRLTVACVVDDDVASQLRVGQPRTARARDDLSVLEGLQRLYARVVVVDALERSTRTLDRLQSLKPDVVFNCAFSAHRQEASLVGALDLLGIPYTGSGPLGIGLANNKGYSSRLLRNSNVNVPQSIELKRGQALPRRLPLPAIVKPIALGSSAGVYADSVATSPADVLRLAKRIWARYEMTALCEEFIVGREFRAAAIEDTHGRMRLTGVIEWHFGRAEIGWGFNTERIKSDQRVSTANDVRRSVVPLSGKTAQRIGEVAPLAMQALQVRGYGAVDVRMNGAGELFVLDVNANPGLRANSPMWHCPTFEGALDRIVGAAFRRRID